MRQDVTIKKNAEKWVEQYCKVSPSTIEEVIRRNAGVIFNETDNTFSWEMDNPRI